MGYPLSFLQEGVHANKTKDNFSYSTKAAKKAYESNFLLLLQDVINYNCRSLVAAVPFFTNAEPEFVSSVVTKLNYEVFQPGESTYRV